MMNKVLLKRFSTKASPATMHLPGHSPGQFLPPLLTTPPQPVEKAVLFGVSLACLFMSAFDLLSPPAQRKQRDFDLSYKARVPTNQSFWEAHSII
ncbi:hypothetical protein DCAR_0414790 [Daucus carota subsp. sativus]|uniref:Uncharacterized protein n=1 Tax=Daucus carota subsp. sativus TaxID=79200 RepID=A0A165A0T0_DAUCS|nr:hypothetical protein DCAR_0414790 [Daucus carota subsp. sativus]